MSFSSILPSSLTPWVDDLNALILDIRPHAAYSSARIPHALSLSVPSTLLKRPLFPLQRLAAMLPSAGARTRFLAWPSASRILVYDADSQVVGESSNINGLLRKFKLDGFQGELVWLQGGFQAVWRDCRQIIDNRPPTPDPENEDDTDVHDKSSQSSILRTRRLPMAAFSLSSTTIHNSPTFNSTSINSVKRPSTAGSQHSLSNPVTSNSHPAYNPFFDTIRQNTELSHGITERIPLRLPRRVRRRICDLPFPWLQSIARRAASTPTHHRNFSESSSSDSSEDYESNAADVEEGKEALAMQFFKIELAEQRRLMGVMEHHSKESGQSENPPQGSPFPFSITAGIEKGAKNRYRHVWPFEHARVRLYQKGEADDDYVNASYIQPLVTTKRYIATQGPLPATFTDFWTLCWEQNVHVIAMLTREVEGAMVKCGAYWTDSAFGPLRLRLISTEGLETPPADQRPATAGFFSQLPVPSSHSHRQFPHSAGSKSCHRPQHYTTDPCETVKRVFELTHTDYPDAEPRKIVQLQYLEWPDMNVPDDPRGLLGFIKQVENAVRETRSARDLNKIRSSDHLIVDEVDRSTGIAKRALGNSPVLLHCSAGVGRTGGFIAVDSILDAIRREIRAERKPDDMDVDSSESPRISSSPTFRVKAHTPLNNDIDIPRPPPMSTTSDIVLWAKAERDVAESQPNLQHNNHPTFQSSKSFTLSSELQSKGPLSKTSHHSSLSVDTSVSATPSPCKVSFTSPDGCTEGHRKIQLFSPPPIPRPMFNPRLLGPSRLMEHSSNTQGLNQSLSSDGEPPSRSQSPSADEANTNISQAPPPIHPILVSSGRLIPTSTSPFSREVEQSMKSFDYKEPRPLHINMTPPDLSNFDDPIWEVVQDMREQRMSLCQTLRQYVFVHAAVIEGALMVLDDEKMITNGLAMPVPRSHPVSPDVRPPPSKSIASQRSPSPSASLRPVLQLYSSDTTSLSSNKRGASPTELLKEDKAGEVMLSKRPSIKRKQAKEDDMKTNARYRPVMPLRVTGTMHPTGVSPASTRSMPP